jgi:hypothetical protein
LWLVTAATTAATIAIGVVPAVTLNSNHIVVFQNGAEEPIVVGKRYGAKFDEQIV